MASIRPRSARAIGGGTPDHATCVEQPAHPPEQLGLGHTDLCCVGFTVQRAHVQPDHLVHQHIRDGACYFDQQAGRVDLARWLDGKPRNFYDATPNLARVVGMHGGDERLAVIEPRLRDFGATVATVIEPGVGTAAPHRPFDWPPNAKRMSGVSPALSTYACP